MVIWSQNLRFFITFVWVDFSRNLVYKLFSHFLDNQGKKCKRKQKKQVQTKMGRKKKEKRKERM